MVSRPPDQFEFRVVCEAAWSSLSFSPLALRVRKRRSNYSLDTVRIAARGQGLLNVGKTILASDQIVETNPLRGSESNCGRPRIGIAECASNEQLALLDHPKKQPQFIYTHPNEDD